MVKDLTKGKVLPLLIRFAAPLVLSNIFQLTYNAVDGMIVGKFVGDEALAAVGICNPIMTLMILFLNGLCLGAGILMGVKYGAGDHEALKLQISTTMIAGVTFSLVLSLFCIVFAHPLLLLMQVNPSILELTEEYLRVIFIGLTFTFLYNFFASTLRALGDSKTPLYFLMASALLNVGGDLLFVIVFRLGSLGCAIATVISEVLCCLFCFVYIYLRVPVLRLGKQWFAFDRKTLRATISYGWVSAMQQATVQLGKIGMQTIVNTMPVPVTAAFTAVNRVDDFAYAPEQNIGNAMTSVMAQNRGAGKKDRVQEAFRYGMLIEVVYGVLVFLIFFFLAEPVMGLFVNAEEEPEVVEHGVRYLHCIAAMYVLPAITNGLQGYFRGIGDLKVTLISSFVNMGVRLVAAIPMVFVFHIGIEALPLSYLIGWIAMLLTEVPLLIKSQKKKTSGYAPSTDDPS